MQLENRCSYVEFYLLRMFNRTCCVEVYPIYNIHFNSLSKIEYSLIRFHTLIQKFSVADILHFYTFCNI